MLRYSVISSASPIEGSGVFAAVTIPRRVKIGELSGRVISRREARHRARDGGRIYLVDVSDARTLDCSEGNVLRFLNHSCSSNAFLRIIGERVEVYARRDIAPGEEITVDYGETPHRGGMQCRCGRPGCRSNI